MGINTNNKSNEITYTTWHARVDFTNMYKALQADKDGFYPPERALYFIHRWLITPS